MYIIIPINIYTANGKHVVPTIENKCHLAITKALYVCNYHITCFHLKTHHVSSPTFQSNQSVKKPSGGLSLPRLLDIVVILQSYLLRRCLEPIYQPSSQEMFWGSNTDPHKDWMSLMNQHTSCG